MQSSLSEGLWLFAAYVLPGLTFLVVGGIGVVIMVALLAIALGSFLYDSINGFADSFSLVRLHGNTEHVKSRFIPIDFEPKNAPIADMTAFSSGTESNNAIGSEPVFQSVLPLLSSLVKEQRRLFRRCSL